MKHSQAFRYWKKTIERFECSGKSLADFCRDEQLSTNSAYKWHKRFKDLFKSNHPQIPGFIEIPTEFSVQNEYMGNSSSQTLQVCLSGDIILKIPSGFSPETLRQVINILREDGSC